jgi:hypothetical protein
MFHYHPGLITLAPPETGTYVLRWPAFFESDRSWGKLVGTPNEHDRIQPDVFEQGKNLGVIPS